MQTSFRELRRFEHGSSGFGVKHITFLVIFGVIILIYADGVGSKNRLLRVFSVLSSLPLEIIVFFLLRLGSLLFNDCCNALPHSLIWAMKLNPLPHSLPHSLTRAMKPEESYGMASEEPLLLAVTRAAPCTAVAGR